MKNFWFTFLALTIALSSCQINSKRPRGEKYGGSLKINSSDVPDLIFPGQVLKMSEQLIVNQVYCGLLKHHPKTLEIEPSLATSWIISNDEKTYTFNLTRNAYFQNDACFENSTGRNIVAADVKYSIEQILHFHLLSQHEISDQIKNVVGAREVVQSGLNNSKSFVSGINALNDSTLTFQLIEPDPMFLYFLSSTNSLVFAKEAFDTYGFKSTVGSGAYYFSYPDVKGKAITLLANPNYFGTNKRGEQLPYLDTIINSFITSPPQELLLFERGDLDFIYNVSDHYITEFLETHIDKFQSNPPEYIMKQTVDEYNHVKYNFLRANIRNLEINSVGYFDFTEVYLKDPVKQEVKVLN